MNFSPEHHSSSISARSRRGVSLLWVIILFPALMILLCLIVELGNIWLTRLELENSLEAAALAAVKEWGDAHGAGGTMTPRQVGNEFAQANSTSGQSVDLSLYDPQLNFNGGIKNGNDVCSNIDIMNTFDPSSVLVFGSITQIADANPNAPQVVFNADVSPCQGDVLVDASSTPNLQGSSSWGINFEPVNALNNLPAGFHISSVIIDLRPAGGLDPDAAFNVVASPPTISIGSLYVGQVDTFGISAAPLAPGAMGPINYTWSNGQVTFAFNVTNPGQLQIFFAPNTFNPGDRIRFGAQVINAGANNGDSIGRIRSQVTVDFSAGANGVARFYDTDFGADGFPDMIGPNPVNNPYVLPPTPSNVNNNDLQSVAFVEVPDVALSNMEFYAVRAQAMREIPSICQVIGGIPLGPWTVSAKSTAYYECDIAEPKLIHIDQFICP